ncbi:MAG: hypothetical protein B7X88_09850 [Polaromonas sp. 17-63-33]|nr:MAG: hypothetical protein B7X88_09850 [Polaromonas sp. 17-63-33]
MVGFLVMVGLVIHSAGGAACMAEGQTQNDSRQRSRAPVSDAVDVFVGQHESDKPLRLVRPPHQIVLQPMSDKRQQLSIK